MACDQLRKLRPNSDVFMERIVMHEPITMSIEKRHSAQVGCSDQSSVAHLSLQMSCYRSFEEAEPLRKLWDALVESIDGDLFSSFDWCTFWWKHFGHGRIKCK